MLDEKKILEPCTTIYYFKSASVKLFSYYTNMFYIMDDSLQIKEVGIESITD
jgi:hypothetical protein